MEGDSIDFESIKRITNENQLIELLINNNYILTSNVIFMCNEPLDVFNRFKLHFNFIAAAGGVVQNKTRDILMIYKRGVWDLPKGKIDDGESEQHAAMREVSEETNVKDLKIISNQFLTYHIYNYRNSSNKLIRVFKQTTWFLMEMHSENQLIPQVHEGIEDVIWVPLKRIKMIKTYPSISCVVKNLLSHHVF